MAEATPETAKLLATLIENELGLDPGVVMIYNQKRNLPANKEGFNVNVAIVADHPFAVNSRFEAVEGQTDLNEVQLLAQQEVVQVDMWSYDNSARLRRIDIIFALTGTAAQQLAEINAFQIGRIPASFVDVSEVEGAKRLNRYALTFNVLRGYKKTTEAQSFDNFDNAVPPTVYSNA